MTIRSVNDIDHSLTYSPTTVCISGGGTLSPIIIPNLLEMAKVTRVPVLWLITRGQQIKVFSQVYKKCLKDDTVAAAERFVTNTDAC